MRLLDASEYQPQAAVIYNLLAAELRRLLPWATIEHIGSSAIPGAISKGDLDIFVGVDADRFTDAAATIESAGFYLKSDTLQTAQLHHFITSRYPIDVAVQLVELCSKFEFFRAFRDLLNQDQRMRDSYNDAKRAAASLDERGYRESKARFIQEALERSSKH